MNWMGGTRKKLLKAAANVHMQQKAGFERFRTKKQSELDLSEKRDDSMNSFHSKLRSESVTLCQKPAMREARSTRSRGSSSKGKVLEHTKSSGYKAKRADVKDVACSLLAARVQNPEGKTGFVDVGMREWHQRLVMEPLVSKSTNSSRSRRRAPSRHREDTRARYEREKEARRHSKEERISQCKQPRVMVGRCPSSRERSTVIEDEWRRFAGAGLGLCGSVGATQDFKKRIVDSNAPDVERKQPSKLLKRARSRSCSAAKCTLAEEASMLLSEKRFRTPSPRYNVLLGNIANSDSSDPSASRSFATEASTRSDPQQLSTLTHGCTKSDPAGSRWVATEEIATSNSQLRNIIHRSAESDPAGTRCVATEENANPNSQTRLSLPCKSAKSDPEGSRCAAVEASARSNSEELRIPTHRSTESDLAGTSCVAAEGSAKPNAAQPCIFPCESEKPDLTECRCVAIDKETRSNAEELRIPTPRSAEPDPAGTSYVATEGSAKLNAPQHRSLPCASAESDFSDSRGVAIEERARSNSEELRIPTHRSTEPDPAGTSCVATEGSAKQNAPQPRSFPCESAQSDLTDGRCVAIEESARSNSQQTRSLIFESAKSDPVGIQWIAIEESASANAGTRCVAIEERTGVNSQQLRSLPWESAVSDPEGAIQESARSTSQHPRSISHESARSLVAGVDTLSRERSEKRRTLALTAFRTEVPGKLLKKDSRSSRFRSNEKRDLGLKDAWSWARSKCGRGSIDVSSDSAAEELLVLPRSWCELSEPSVSTLSDDTPPTQLDEVASQASLVDGAAPTEHTFAKPVEEMKINEPTPVISSSPAANAVLLPDVSKLHEDEASREASDSAHRVMRTSSRKTLSIQERRRLCGVFLHG